MNIQTLQAYAEVKILWNKMCKALGMDPQAKFVAGIPETAPYYKEYNAAMNRFQRAVNAEINEKAAL